MKTLLTALVISSSLLMASQVVKADDDDYRPVRPHTPEQVVNRMAYKLNLTEEQRKNILPIIEENMAKTQALRMERRQKVASFLNDEQKQRMEYMRPHGGDKRCEGKKRWDD